jgi:hypothetical protein
MYDWRTALKFKPRKKHAIEASYSDDRPNSGASDNDRTRTVVTMAATTVYVATPEITALGAWTHYLSFLRPG